MRLESIEAHVKEVALLLLAVVAADGALGVGEEAVGETVREERAATVVGVTVCTGGKELGRVMVGGGAGKEVPGIDPADADALRGCEGCEGGPGGMGRVA
eukprot:CAMPEP_0174738954 /NCGR_PEP_ID=MMETSP1094-20130205/70759_1 /TAXON_ID=156173 /ORGANISM="Chrysochromulina brevifilum, Strain UTEX LB 985" /LENGTH=99 /DNA_ID=CAMNT_0015942455 /DNA_START=354 /DNA_END=654 /DNA_ORIENTATION=-